MATIPPAPVLVPTVAPPTAMDHNLVFIGNGNHVIPTAAPIPPAPATNKPNPDGKNETSGLLIDLNSTLKTIQASEKAHLDNVSNIVTALKKTAITDWGRYCGAPRSCLLAGEHWYFYVPYYLAILFCIVLLCFYLSAYNNNFVVDTVKNLQQGETQTIWAHKICTDAADCKEAILGHLTSIDGALYIPAWRTFQERHFGFLIASIFCIVFAAAISWIRTCFSRAGHRKAMHFCVVAKAAAGDAAEEEKLKKKLDEKKTEHKDHPGLFNCYRPHHEVRDTNKALKSVQTTHARNDVELAKLLKKLWVFEKRIAVVTYIHTFFIVAATCFALFALLYFNSLRSRLNEVTRNHGNASSAQPQQDLARLAVSLWFVVLLFQSIFVVLQSAMHITDRQYLNYANFGARANTYAEAKSGTALTDLATTADEERTHPTPAPVTTSDPNDPEVARLLRTKLLVEQYDADATWRDAVIKVYGQTEHDHIMRLGAWIPHRLGLTGLRHGHR